MKGIVIRRSDLRPAARHPAKWRLHLISQLIQWISLVTRGALVISVMTSLLCHQTHPHPLQYISLNESHLCALRHCMSSSDTPTSVIMSLASRDALCHTSMTMTLASRDALCHPSMTTTDYVISVTWCIMSLLCPSLVPGPVQSYKLTHTHTHARTHARTHTYTRAPVTVLHGATNSHQYYSSCPDQINGLPQTAARTVLVFFT